MLQYELQGQAGVESTPSESESLLSESESIRPESRVQVQVPAAESESSSPKIIDCAIQS